MVTEPTIGDAFGATLMACYEAGMEPGSVYEIIERDDGFIDVGDAARYFSPDPGAMERGGTVGDWEGTRTDA